MSCKSIIVSGRIKWVILTCPNSPPLCHCPKRCGYIDIEYLEWYRMSGLVDLPREATREEIDDALSHYVFDFDDTMSDGRLEKGQRLTMWEDKRYAAWTDF